ncbi:MAG: HepT-like ribonuclease domain-containing protein [Bacteroidota bacterium]
MDNTIKAWLFDIYNAISEIESFFEGRSKLFDEYVTDLRTKRAVERNIEIIGEAMNRILKQLPEIAISNSRKIVDLRNRIIHSYDAISDELIWGIVIKNLPELKTEVAFLLEIE